MRKPRVEHTTFELEGYPLPVTIHRERRRNIRTSIGKKAILIRMPSQLGAAEDLRQLEISKEWLQKKIQQNPSLVAHYFFRVYQEGDILRVGKKSYLIKISEVENKRNSARLTADGSTIHLKLSTAIQGRERWKDVQSLLSRVIASDFLPEITKRVHQLNALHFQKPINSIRLKHNYSNSGSCSTKGNINLSTRLLFAPEVVIDYVIIHELAHLIEMNHSPKFWRLVEQAMPNYRDCEKWLKANSKKMGF
jgi:hypothetical protein